MQGWSATAVDVAMAAGASYADARLVQHESDAVHVRNGSLEDLTSGRSRGLGVRVIAGGAWGFAATSELTDAVVREAARRAVDLARAAATTATEPVRLAPVEPATDDVRARFEVDPRDVPLPDRVALLMECDRLMRRQQIAVAEGRLSVLRQSRHLCTSEGAEIYEERIETGAGISATAVDGRESQRRSYPASHGGQAMTRGWEVIEELRLADHAEEIAAEAVALLNAPICPSGPMDLILAGGQLGLQLHESCGHPIELDRVLGTEASYAGMSFLTPDKLGSFRYGSPLVNITADATIPGGLGSFGYDDEGVPAQRTDIVREGIFVGYLTSRETAATLGLGASNGCMRADGWARLPIIRMTNINLEPGDTPLAEIIATTERGILIEHNLSWSIDDRRLNFQFGGEVGRMIEDGQITGIVRNPTYTGITPEFWGSCDAVADADTWLVQGLANCGKGEPGQTAHVGHGVSAARFRGVRVGVLSDE
ncbi:MAG TPA: TldD/PmbA family protein [Armatimonadota bacterium]|nr:TldD/PmbA family protein [Armatimonadota bacterium]